MKKVLFFIVTFVLQFCFATELNFQEEILKTKVEQQFAYAAVKKAMGKEINPDLKQDAQNQVDTLVVKIVQVNQ